MIVLSEQLGEGSARVARRREIHDAALELFAENGYRATTMADIGRALGMRGPSLYNHVASKQEILLEIMSETMAQLIADQKVAIKQHDDPDDQLRAVAAAHMRYHLRHRLEAFVGNSELRSLTPENAEVILRARTKYERGLRRVIQRLIALDGASTVSAKLASYAILDLGMGAAVWYRQDGAIAEDDVVEFYAVSAVRLVAGN